MVRYSRRVTVFKSNDVTEDLATIVEQPAVEALVESPCYPQRRAGVPNTSPDYTGSRSSRLHKTLRSLLGFHRRI